MTTGTSSDTGGAPASRWTEDQLRRISAADEVEVATRRDDSTLSRPRIVWIVRCGNAVFVRSVNGVDADWYRAALNRHEGRLTAGDVDSDVRFTESPSDPDNGLDAALDAAYRAKYHRWPSAVAHITAQPARRTTLRVDPAT